MADFSDPDLVIVMSIFEADTPYGQTRQEYVYDPPLPCRDAGEDFSTWLLLEHNADEGANAIMHWAINAL